MENKENQTKATGFTPEKIANEIREEVKEKVIAAGEYEEDDFPEEFPDAVMKFFRKDATIATEGLKDPKKKEEFISKVVYKLC